MQHPAEQVKKQYTEYKREGSEIHLLPTSFHQKYPGSVSRVSRLVQICLLQLATAHDVRGSDGG